MAVTVEVRRRDGGSGSEPIEHVSAEDFVLLDGHLFVVRKPTDGSGQFVNIALYAPGQWTDATVSWRL